MTRTEFVELFFCEGNEVSCRHPSRFDVEPDRLRCNCIRRLEVPTPLHILEPLLQAFSL